MRALALTAALLGLAGCGGYSAGGACTQDTDCELCTVCTCQRAYSLPDTKNATCDAIVKDASCPSGTPDDCQSSGALQALCISGQCETAAR